MRIGIGAMAASSKPGVRQSGIYRYALELISALPNVLGAQQLVVYAGSNSFQHHDDRMSIHNPAVSIEHPAARVAWENLALPLRARRDRLDLFHGLAFTLPRALRTPGIVTIHDLAFLKWPEQVPSRRSEYLSRAVRESAQRAVRVIAVSEHTKCDVMELLGVSEKRIDVTPLGVDTVMRQASHSAVTQFRDANGLSNPFILAVGNLEPRKNFATLIHAFAAISDQLPHDLILVGAEGWRTGEIHQALTERGARGRVRLQGFVGQQELPLWYSACDMFVIPSLYEGFGLTLLEALACGAPAIASNRSALPEVAGDAAILAEPEAEPLAAAVLNLANDEAFRIRLSGLGPKQAANFTWRRTAALTVESYRRALE